MTGTIPEAPPQSDSELPQVAAPQAAQTDAITPQVQIGVPDCRTTPQQLVDKVRAINADNKRVWDEHAEQLSRLEEERGVDAADHLMEDARLIADQYTLSAGVTSVSAAVAAAEKLDAHRKEAFQKVGEDHNARRQRQADLDAISQFREWEQRRTGVLGDKDSAQRVEFYLNNKEVKDRQRRRIRGLLKAGRLEPEK